MAGELFHVVADGSVVRQQAAGNSGFLVEGAEIVVPVVSKTGGMAKQIANRNFFRGRN